jgi:hypothetical protein
VGERRAGERPYACEEAGWRLRGGDEWASARVRGERGCRWPSIVNPATGHEWSSGAYGRSLSPSSYRSVCRGC